MSRLPELKRLEKALETGNETELEWAAKYCSSRLSWVPNRKHQRHWEKMLRKVEAAQTED